MKIFAVYKGDEFIVLGTAKECSDFTGLKESVIRWHATPAGQRRSESRQDQSRALRIIRVEDD